MGKFGTACFRGPGSVPGCRPIPLVSGPTVAVTHIQNRGRLAHMLAQGQSSSPEKKRDDELWPKESYTRIKGIIL